MVRELSGHEFLFEIMQRSFAVVVMTGVESFNTGSGHAVNISHLHSMHLSNTLAPNDADLPFVVEPVGHEYLAVASDSGVVMLDWLCKEEESAVVCSLVEVAAASYSFTSVSVREDFDFLM